MTVLLTHVDIGSGIALRDQLAEPDAHGVAQHESGDQEGDTQHHGGTGADEPAFVAPDAFQNGAQHDDQPPIAFRRSRTLAAVGDAIRSTMRPSARNTTESA